MVGKTFDKLKKAQTPLAVGTGTTATIAGLISAALSNPVEYTFLSVGAGLSVAVAPFAGPRLAVIPGLWRMARVLREADNLCGSIEGKIAELPADYSGDAVMAQLLDGWLDDLAKFWNLYLGCGVRPVISVRVQKVGVQKQLADQNGNASLPLLETICQSHRAPTRKSTEPGSLPCQRTISGSCFGSGEVRFVDDLSKEAEYQECLKLWPRIDDHVCSLIAVPIRLTEHVQASNGETLRSEVVAVLTIDCSKTNAFRNNLATRFLAELCANKVSLILQVGTYVGRVAEYLSKKEKQAKDALKTERALRKKAERSLKEAEENLQKARETSEKHDLGSNQDTA